MPVDAVGQVHLGERIHQLQELHSLGVMSANILFTVVEMAQQFGRIGGLSPSDRLLSQYESATADKFNVVNISINDGALPSMTSVANTIRSGLNRFSRPPAKFIFNR